MLWARCHAVPAFGENGATTKVQIDAAARADLEALVLRIERHFKARTGWTPLQLVALWLNLPQCWRVEELDIASLHSASGAPGDGAACVLCA